MPLNSLRVQSKHIAFKEEYRNNDLKVIHTWSCCPPCCDGGKYPGFSDGGGGGGDNGLDGYA